MTRTPEERAELTAKLVEAYQAGASLKQLERRFNVAASYAGRLIKRAGVELRPPGRDDPAIWAGNRLRPRHQDEYLRRLKQVHQG